MRQTGVEVCGNHMLPANVFLHPQVIQVGERTGLVGRGAADKLGCQCRHWLLVGLILKHHVDQPRTLGLYCAGPKTWGNLRSVLPLWANRWVADAASKSCKQDGKGSQSVPSQKHRLQRLA